MSVFFFHLTMVMIKRMTIWI